MAKPITETPILKGKDAKAFLNAIEDKNVQKISQEERERIKQNYDKLKDIAKFNF